MSALSNSLRVRANAAVTAAKYEGEALDRSLTEHEAVVKTAQLQSRKLDVKVSDLQAQIAAALAL